MFCFKHLKTFQGCALGVVLDIKFYSLLCQHSRQYSENFLVSANMQIFWEYSSTLLKTTIRESVVNSITVTLSHWINVFQLLTHHAFFCCAVRGMRATINEVFLGIKASSSVYTRNQRTDTTCKRNKMSVSLLNILLKDIWTILLTLLYFSLHIKQNYFPVQSSLL